MSIKAARVLAYLKRWGPTSGSQLALALDMPVPSVRRCVQELLREGHNITFATGNDNRYQFVSKEQTYGE